jgi:signal recognition particle receptor subunit beta
MVSAHFSSRVAPTPTTLTPVKIVISGGFGVGKTTFVGTVSEIPPLTTEAVLTEASIGIDDLSHVRNKGTTTVAMDFGRITLANTGVLLYIFGTPGQDRFWFMWDELVQGAVGAVVLADTRRLDDSFPAIDFFEERDIPFLVAVNDFDGARKYPLDAVRDALDINPRRPVVYCDARESESAKDTLIKLVCHALDSALATGGARREG